MLGPSDGDGPKNFHVVLVDSGRSRLIGGEAEEVLRCIRCSACLNHCPIYGAVGGHAYGATYPGPIGAALNPACWVWRMPHISPMPPPSAAAARKSAR